jgi:23S rRNA (cytosine1962-C5)-methyltransferase
MSDKLAMFQNRLLKVYKHKSKHANRLGISCWRVYDHDLPEFPFCIELYGTHIYLAEYLRRHGLNDTEHEEWLQDCISIICIILDKTPNQVFIRQRKRMHHKGQQYERLGVVGDFFTVQESGLNFSVNLTDYLDTGLFLDHRITRQMVKEIAANKKVLNLFAYTGSFSVYAAAGKAHSVTTVDLSKTYLNWAEENFKLNQLENSHHQFIHADVLQWLTTIKPASYDLVIMDPPTFSNSKRMKDFLDIQQDHVWLINQVLKALTAGGKLFFSTNYTKFILSSNELEASSIKDITKATTPFDFEGKLKRWCYLLEK